jgi:predicted DNA-binding protein
MATYTIQLADQSTKRLEELARTTGVSPERLLSEGIEEWLNGLQSEGLSFAEAAAYVLKKNRELYRRLAQ